MADARVHLRWEGQGLSFAGGAEGGVQLTLDGNGQRGPSPTQLLLLSLAGCMGADIVDIALKARASLSGLEVAVTADRAPQPPRRFTRIALRFICQGAPPADEPRLQRALALSRETYCSVLHTLRPDLELEFTLELH